jgi:hypothetical protein
MCNREFRGASLLLALLALVVPPGFAGPGELDVRFGTHGWRDVPEMSSIAAAVALPDGSVVVVGSKWPSGDGLVNPFPDLQVSRIDAAGRTLWTMSPGIGYAGTAIRLPTGRILVANGGYSDEGASQIVALLENGEVDTGFGSQGRITLQRSQLVSGAGLTHGSVSFSSMREMTDGSILVAALVSNDTIPTPWDPATQGVVFRMGSNGALLDPPRPADLLFQQRFAALAQPTGDGRSLVLANTGCCEDLRGLLLSRDASGALEESPASRDSALSLGALAFDEANRRFYALGRWNSNSVLVAGDAAGALDTSFGTDGTGRVAFPLAPDYESVGLLVDEDASVVTFRMLEDGFSRDVDLRVTPRAQFFVGRRNVSGLPDPRIDSSVAVPLADQETGATASILRVAPGTGGFAWVSATVDHSDISYGPGTGVLIPQARLAKLQLGRGSGAGTLGFQVSSIRIAEQGSAQSVRVVRSGGSSGAVSVRYAVTSLPAGAGDLKSTSGTLAWADGDATARTIEIQAQDDALLEGEERYSFGLLDPAGGAEIAGVPLVATIEDDEALALLAAEARSTGIFAGQTAEFVLRLRRPVSGPVTVTALIADSVDANDWPRHTGKNSSGWVRQTVGWSAGDTGERVVRLPTNGVGDSMYSADLYLRLATVAGLVRQTADVGSFAVGSRVAVSGGQPPPPVLDSTPTLRAATGSGSGGGGIDVWALVSLFLLFLRRNLPIGVRR